MARPPRTGVIYPGIDYGGKPLVVERLHPRAINIAQAHAVQQVLGPAYAAQLEKPTGSLPPGSVKQHLFDAGDRKKVLAQHGRMSSHAAKYNSEYWFVGDPDDQDLYVGVAKVTPRGLEADTPFGYFNDVAVHPDAQRHGIGRALAHAAIKFGPMPPDRPMALEGYAGSPVNSWYENEWGMVCRGVDPEGLEVGNDVVPQLRYITESGLTVAGVAARLEAAQPALAAGHVVALDR